MHTVYYRRGETPSPEYLAEVTRANDLEAEFLASHRLGDYRWGPGNLGRILRSGGADRRAVRDLLRNRLAGGYSVSGCFDHARCLGRDRVPLMLVGHPYPYNHKGTTPAEWLDADEWSLLEAIRGLGVDVVVEGPSASFYGFGTVHVRVTSRDYA